MKYLISVKIPTVKNVSVEFLSTAVTTFYEVCVSRGLWLCACAGDPACIWVTTTAVVQGRSGWTTSSVLAMRCL